jgi:hypothetical protein
VSRFRPPGSLCRKRLALRRNVLASATALLLWLGLAFTPVAAAEAPEGDARPTAALAACVSGDVAAGIGLLGQLYAETRDPSFLFNQGRCYQQNSQLEQARTRFAEYLRVGKNEPPDDLARARALMKEIDEVLARQRPAETRLVLIAPAAPAPAYPPGERRARALRVTSIALAAVGAAAVASGVYMGLKVRSIENDINGEFAGQAVVTDGGRLQRQLTDGTRYETWQWVSYGVGVAALAGAATTFLVGRFSSVTSTSGGERSAMVLEPLLSPGGAGGRLLVRF